MIKNKSSPNFTIFTSVIELGSLIIKTVMTLFNSHPFVVIGGEMCLGIGKNSENIKVTKRNLNLQFL